MGVQLTAIHRKYIQAEPDIQHKIQHGAHACMLLHLGTGALEGWAKLNTKKAFEGHHTPDVHTSRSGTQQRRSLLLS